MSKRKRKAPNSGEPACVLCGRADADPAICGRTFDNSGIRVHEFCLIFANIAFEERPIWERTVGLPIAAIRRKVKEANKKQCCVCGERGAALTCAESGCALSFHLPCAADGECVTQFFGRHRSFCREHHPRQEIQEAPEQGTTCVICLETVGDSASYHTLVCPACRSAWFHRGCVQQQAMNAGTRCFRCPICRDKDEFHSEMYTLGIKIPDRRPSWEDSNVYDPLLERHRRCDVSQCLYPGGRDRAERRGPWQLILCSSCAAEGTHRQCSFLSNTRASWECNSCAGLGTASSDNNELASQAALGTSHSSQLPQHSDLLSEPGTEQRTNRPRLCEDHAISEQLRGHHGSRRTAAPSAESHSRTSTRRRTSGSSRASLAAARRRRPRQRGRSRTRSRSPLQGRAPRSQTRPRRCQSSRQRPAPGDQSSTHSSARSTVSRSLRDSLGPERRGRTMQRGRAPIQSPSPERHPAYHSHSSLQRGSRSQSQQQRPSQE
ncbi:PHD finger protein 7-like [Numida meleagris]|uniref:PHD finger protein 7-like n=1 Tax=Numida meleagris TaxID=8996 RepID=UPI000B3E3AE9|nr:PHD finger protein 7-like [Numida meleagris]